MSSVALALEPTKAPELQTAARRLLARHIDEDAIPALLELKRRCIDTSFAGRFYGNLVRELQEQKEDLLTEEVRLSLLAAFEDGFKTDQQLAAQTWIPITEVRRNMRLLEAEGYFFEQDLVWKQTTARGIRSKEWKRTAKLLPAEVQTELTDIQQRKVTT